jgi:hypothetical protein
MQLVTRQWTGRAALCVLLAKLAVEDWALIPVAINYCGYSAIVGGGGHTNNITCRDLNFLDNCVSSGGDYDICFRQCSKLPPPLYLDFHAFPYHHRKEF